MGGISPPVSFSLSHKYLDAYRETFALPEYFFPVFVPVVFNNQPPAQDRGGGDADCHGAVTDMLTGWSMNLQRK